MREKHTEKKYIGTVIFLNHRRGYGWIKCENIPEDVFFHFNAGSKSDTHMEIGTVVRFELDINKPGLIAQKLGTLIQSD